MFPLHLRADLSEIENLLKCNMFRSGAHRIQTIVVSYSGHLSSQMAVANKQLGSSVANLSHMQISQSSF